MRILQKFYKEVWKKDVGLPLGWKMYTEYKTNMEESSQQLQRKEEVETTFFKFKTWISA